MGVTLFHEHFKWETDESYANKLYFDKDCDDEKDKPDFDLIAPIKI